MQKLWFGLFGLIITTGAFAADLCVRNDAMVVAMDPLVNGTVASYNATPKVWSTKFNYGIISGIAACYTQQGITQGTVSPNQNLSSFSYGGWCYCKTLRPIVSQWIASGYSGNSAGVPDACNRDCAHICANYTASQVGFRRAIFRHINSLE